MSVNHIEHRAIKPNGELADFVESYWLLRNHSDQEQEVVILPDGRVDIMFFVSSTEPDHVIIRGLDSEPSLSAIWPNATIFAVSLTLLAVEYVLDVRIAALLNTGAQLPAHFWGIEADDLTDFDAWRAKISLKIKSLLQSPVDERKRKLVSLLYASNGSLTVKELADTVHWSSRQINRYFSEWFGLSLKAYCNILRFRASFKDIKEGKLFPEQNFTDQAHFIHQVKKYAGVAPKELSRNSNDRFIQFSLLPRS